MFESLGNGVVTLQPKIINHPSLHLAAVEPLPPSLATASTLCSLKCIRICVSFSPWRGGSDSDLVVYFGVLVMSGRGAGVIPVGSFLLEDSFIPPGGPFERLLQPSRGVQPPTPASCVCVGGGTGVFGQERSIISWSHRCTWAPAEPFRGLDRPEAASS